jgi:hypothetical protein
MYSTRSVGSCFTHSTKCWAELFPAGDSSSPTGSGPMRFIEGAGRESNLLSHVLHHGSRACLLLSPKDRRGCGQRTAANRVRCAVVTLRQICRRDSHPHVRIPMYSNLAVGLFSNCNGWPNEVCAKSAWVTAVRIRGAFAPLTVDWLLRLQETPAPFTSRSPGVATLGPSCTPDRQLGCQS